MWLMRRIVGTLALAWFRARNWTEDWLRNRGTVLHRRLVALAGLLFWVSNLAAPQALTPQDLETLRQQWEHRQRAEFWSNVFELIAAAATGWVIWLVRVHWIQILKTFWKYLKVSFRVPIEIVDMKDRNATTRSELLDGQREIIARQTLLAARINILEDHGAVASFVADQHGAWQTLTKEMSEIVGDHPHNLIGYGWKVRIMEDDRDRVMTSWIKAIKYSEPFSADFYFVSTSGKKRKVRMIAYQQLGPQGPAGYVGQVFKIPATGEVPPIARD
jgi:hypothetical protein